MLFYDNCGIVKRELYNTLILGING
jgi:hypothetical protein